MQQRCRLNNFSSLCNFWLSLVVCFSVFQMSSRMAVAEPDSDTSVGLQELAVLDPTALDLDACRQAIRDAGGAIRAHITRMQAAEAALSELRSESAASEPGFQALRDAIAALEAQVAEKRAALAAAVEALPDVQKLKEQTEVQQQQLAELHRVNGRFRERHKALVRDGGAGDTAGAGELEQD